MNKANKKNGDAKKNSDIKKLREMIERATAAPTDAARNIMWPDLDAETASLRRGWLQLGKLIEEEMGVSGAPVGTGHVRMPRPAARRRPAWPLWVATSAAAMLVVGGIAWAVHLFGAHEPQMHLQQIAANDDPPKQPAKALDVPKPPLQKILQQAVRSPPSAQPQRHIAESGDHLEWSDSVDDEISAVGEATMYVKQDGLAQPIVWKIETGLNELKQEVEQGSL